MAVRSGFWNSSGSDIRRYYNSDFSHLISLLINDGVSQNYGDSLIPTTGNGMTVVIQTGEAWFNDIWLRNDTDLVIDIDAAPIVNNYSRLDAIAIKIDASSGVRDGTIVYVAGTPTAGTPTLPEMVDTADVHWHILASVLVKTNDTSIPRERITNYVGSNTTPLITGLLETVSTEDLIQQWQAEFNSWNSSKQAEFEAWVETIRGILDEEAAGHLQLEIEDLYSKTHTNLLNPTLNSTTLNGVTCTANGDGTYTLSGTNTSTTETLMFRVTPFGIEHYNDIIKLPLGKYRICGCPSGGSVGTYLLDLAKNDGNTRVDEAKDIGNGATFEQTDATIHYEVHIKVYPSATLPNLTFKPMLTTDLSATYDDFVQYSGPGELNENVAEMHANKQDKTDNALTTTAKTIVGAINELLGKFANYFTKSEINTTLDNYYTKTTTNNLLNAKQDAATAITTSNIAQQSVNYAQGARSANHATSADVADTAGSVPWTGVTNKPALVGGYSGGGSCWPVTSIGKFTDTSNILANAGQGGNFYWGVAAWSDERLKENIEDTKVYGLDKINDVHMVEFDFKDSKKYGGHKDIGYIAQELKEVIPECVVKMPVDDADKETYGTDTMYMVEDKHIIPYLVKAIQELSTEVDDLKRQLEMLKK